MRVGLDISNAVLPSPTGVANYIGCLAQELRQMPGVDLRYFCRRSRRRYLDTSTPLPALHSDSIHWFSSHVSRRDIDVFHATDVRVPTFCGVPMVSTIHDLTALQRSDHATRRFLRKKRRSYDVAARRARRLITHTESVRHEIVRQLSVSPDRIDSILLADALSARLRNSSDHANASDPELQHDLLVVGGPSRRKGVHDLHRVLLSLFDHRGDCRRLQWVGSASRESAQQLFKEHQLDGRIVFHGHVGDAQLDRMYRSCAALLVFSESEGFGMPLLEAAARRCPVIAPDTQVFRELLGNSGFYYEWHLRPAQLDPFFDAQLRSQRIAAAYERSADFSWERTARETVACYRSALAAG